MPSAAGRSSRKTSRGSQHRLAVVVAAVGLLMAGCTAPPEPLGLMDAQSQEDAVAADEAPEGPASALSQPIDEMGGVDEPPQPEDPAAPSGPASAEDPVQPSEPVPDDNNDDLTYQAPPELEVATSGASAMSEGAYLALPRYVRGFGIEDRAFADCRAANSDLRPELRNESNPCVAQSVSVGGLLMPVVRACGTIRTTNRYLCRDFARLYTVGNQGRFDGGDRSSRWVLSLDHAPGVALEGALDVIEVDPTSGDELRPVCGVGDASASGNSMCAADTMRPQVTSRAWRITMPKAQVSSGFASMALAGTAAVVRQAGSSITVSNVAPGLRARVDAGRVLIGAAPAEEWQQLPGVTMRPHVEIVIDARESDVDVAGMPRTTDGVAPKGCPDEFRVRAGERRVLCRMGDEEAMGFFQLNFTRFVLSQGTRSRDIPWAIVRAGPQDQFRTSSAAAATISTEQVGPSATRVTVVPRRAKEVGLVATDPYRVTGTLVLDTSALGDATVQYAQAWVEDGRTIVEGCESAQLRYVAGGVHQLCSFTLRPARIANGIGFDDRSVYLRSNILSSATRNDSLQEIAFVVSYTAGVPRSYAVRVNDVRSAGGVLVEPTITWTASDAFTVTIPAQRP